MSSSLRNIYLRKLINAGVVLIKMLVSITAAGLIADGSLTPHLLSCSSTMPPNTTGQRELLTLPIPSMSAFRECSTRALLVLSEWP